MAKDGDDDTDKKTFLRSLEEQRAARARALIAEAQQALASHDRLLASAREKRGEADVMLERIPAWESAATKAPAWTAKEAAEEMVAEAARSLGAAETQLISALSIAPSSNQAEVSRALAALYYRQLQAAEEADDRNAALKYEALARKHDIGNLAAALRNEGTMVLETSSAGSATIERYEKRRGVFVLESPTSVERGATELRTGSYLLRIRTPHIEVRYPLVIKRGDVKQLKIRIPDRGEIPEGMIYVPAGSFVARPDPRGLLTRPEDVGDFAISRYPVTLREYCAFLESLDRGERFRRMPQTVSVDNRPLQFVVRDEETGEWSLGKDFIEGPGRELVPPEREMDLPVGGICLLDAVAYTEWLSDVTRRAYRLPADVEWEKAYRGADGRLFAMGPDLDPSFAKLRESRRGLAQPEPVGAFALDESPYGVRDMTGGVGELTLSAADGEGPLPDDHDPTANWRLVIYRGANFSATAAIRNALRFAIPVLNRSAHIGFRVALSLNTTGSSSEGPSRSSTPHSRSSPR